MPQVPDQFIACTSDTEIDILLNKDTFEPDAAVFVICDASAQQGHVGDGSACCSWTTAWPIPLWHSHTVTFCSVHVHDVVAKKRDASSSLLRRLHAHMVQHNVDFIGGDLGLGGLDDTCRECTGFLIMPKRPYEWRSLFCPVQIHNVVAKKRDASTELLQRLHGYMKQHNVDFIGGDLNMSAFSTIGGVCSDTEFSAPGNSFLSGLGALEELYRERTGRKPILN